MSWGNPRLPELQLDGCVTRIWGRVCVCVWGGVSQEKPDDVGGPRDLQPLCSAHTLP